MLFLKHHFQHPVFLIPQLYLYPHQVFVVQLLHQDFLKVIIALKVLLLLELWISQLESYLLLLS
jgi:hypothetical protein